MSESPEPADRTRADPGPSEVQGLQWQIMNSLGIISQLSAARSRLLLDDDLPMSLFTILNHFQRLGGDRTITDLARAFQVPQPGMTKSVKKLLDRGLLRMEGDPQDGRRKRLFITDAGQRAHQEALSRLAPDLGHVFGDWQTEDLRELDGYLFRLRRWLDTHRQDTRPTDED